MKIKKKMEILIFIKAQKKKKKVMMRKKMVWKVLIKVLTKV